jgi:5'-nucleotidase
MNVLISNDDGICAPGIYALAAQLCKHHKVTISAPDVERSGSGHSFTFARPLFIKEIKLPELNLEAYSISGTPADCVKLGLAELMPEADVVITGINRGSNLGADTLYSGTIAGALEGALKGRPSIALSSCAQTDNIWRPAAEFALKAIERIVRIDALRHTALNVNFPNLPPEELRGTKITKLWFGNRRSEYVEQTTIRGERCFWLVPHTKYDAAAETTDERCIAEGYVSITPISYDLTKTELIEQLESEFCM